MNERIKQLANIWANRRAEDEKLGIVYTFSEPALEQFAELIVRECMKLNSKELSITAIERLLPLYKEHFGVEE
jgi:hypothetical protein